MLYLQRASAGSGKTYSLARTYLKLLLGIQRDDRTGYRLRLPNEISDAHAHLLAITFTNKATAEMRRRFIERLADLAHPQLYASADYMADFVAEFKAPAQAIQRIAALALSAILNHYSDFQVSTIDSFFQQILHSFTYEAELPDNYLVELDSDAIISAALELLFNQAKANPKSDAYYWLSVYMSQRRANGLKWNLSQVGNGGAYGDLFKYLSMIDKEDFKQQRDALDSYFRQNPDMRALYARVKMLADDYLDICRSRVNELTNNLLQFLDKCELTPHTASAFDKRIEKIRHCIDTKTAPDGALKPLKAMIKLSGLKLIDEDAYDSVKELESKWLMGVNSWAAAPGYCKLVLNSIPLIALIRLLREHIETFRTENNIVQLSDTNTILSTITAGAEVPFIYEKIGTEIESYMIDEFQDTSAMQWDNMRPLVEQSMALGHENLIIGDAKQSIYRFRNADCTLITTEVPRQFAGQQLTILGRTPQENANWRSAPEVVRFNNSFFYHLAARLNEANTQSGINAAYSSVLQLPMKTKKQGYVCVHKSATSCQDDIASVKNVAMAYLGPVIRDMLARGYRQRDIAVLVRTNVEGQLAVSALMAYNAAAKNHSGFQPIEFISDDSLLIARAKSVETAISMLRAIKGEILLFDKQKEADIKADADNRNSRVAYSKKTVDLETALHRMRADFPSLTTEELLEIYLKGKELPDHARELLMLTKSTALPALVENIMALYVPDEIRKRETQYICAFQDAVANFCQTHCNDVASFLHWWDENKKRLTVTSPEDADAVNILTIHKSKGLEWRCVIVADANFSLSISAGEKAWVAPAFPFSNDAPPLLPVSLKAKKAFVNTPFENVYLEKEAQTQLDSLNVAYVAFTRAVDELHIYVKPAENKESIAKAMIDFIDEGTEAFVAPDMHDEGLFADASLLTCYKQNADEAGPLLTCGQKPDLDFVAASGQEADEQTNSVCVKTLAAYHVNPKASIPQYVVVDNLPATDMEGNENQRRLGSVKHAVLEQLTPTHDIDAELEKAILKCVVRGLLTEPEAVLVKKDLLKALSLPQVQEWFGPNVNVLAERTIFDGENQDVRRPDRVVVYPDGSAIVIDYKFGREEKKHIAQVGRYVKLLTQTHRYTSVRGVVWYLATGKLHWLPS